MKFAFRDTLETVGSITDTLVKGMALILVTSVPVVVAFYFLAGWALDQTYKMDPDTKAHVERACEGRRRPAQVGAFHYDCAAVYRGADPREW